MSCVGTAMKMNVDFALFGPINTRLWVIDIAIFVKSIIFENGSFTEEFSLGVSFQDSTSLVVVFFRSQLEF